ncbi:hypothetical protein BACPLE_01043 [Phocaeicola plebeius DSM 17135]|uniref:Uncharacterized protein n=1 Tax=Phocaeicola plebeius (strain DSM 17135 / JCM 12973 / CCUG 54634 / M2) TaxID=484018 RepID=B5CWF3_PHOPM|nr:hypothetical protein BACPLE_01043 [Phocaeicola plebeius DSM 17135]
MLYSFLYICKSKTKKILIHLGESEYQISGDCQVNLLSFFRFSKPEL